MIVFASHAIFSNTESPLSKPNTIRKMDRMDSTLPVISSLSTPTSHASFWYGIGSIKERASRWIPRLCIIFLLLIVFLTTFLIGCAVHISYGMHLKITLKQSQSNRQSQFFSEVPTKSLMLSSDGLEYETATFCGVCDEAFIHPGMISHPNPKVKQYKLPNFCSEFTRDESLTYFTFYYQFK